MRSGTSSEQFRLEKNELFLNLFVTRRATSFVPSTTFDPIDAKPKGFGGADRLPNPEPTFSRHCRRIARSFADLDRGFLFTSSGLGLRPARDRRLARELFFLSFFFF